MAKRLFDLLASTIGILVLFPVFLIIGILIKLDSSGPVFFRQVRVGRNGITFSIHKFRTMRQDAEAVGLQLTTSNDTRITRLGLFLRKYKLDELPQLLDVITGHMSIVGPRPEVPRYVNHYPNDLKELILSVRPGITDPASIKYKDENQLLENAYNAEEIYIKSVLPEKLKIYHTYVINYSLYKDIYIILKTIFGIFEFKKVLSK